MPSAEDREREPFRWCVYCDVDCDVEKPEHTAECPTNTGLYPVRERDLGPVCEHCGKPSLGMSCWICGEVFVVGDFYVLVDGEAKPAHQVPGIEGAFFAGVCTCVGCAATKVAA
jgi:hypothetical protein